MSAVLLGMPGIGARETRDTRPLFEPYTKLPRIVPRRAWLAVRAVTVTAYFSVVVVLLLAPRTGLILVWGLTVPLLPALFLIAPGVWRNVCPLAAANQVPRLLGFTRGRSAPRWLRERGFLLAVLLFLVVVGLRRPVLNDQGAVTALVLAVIILAAFTGGFLVKGKGGWCSSTCPLLPVQRLYGQTPFVVSPNSHCEPCVGCAKNCYDFNPTAAYQADLYDEDPDWPVPRRAFAGVFPGVVYGYFRFGGQPTPTYLTHLALAALVSAGSLFLLNAATRLSWSRLTAVSAALAFGLYYWWSPSVFVAAVQDLLGVDVAFLVGPVRWCAIVVAAVWVARTFDVERRFLAAAVEGASARLSGSRLSDLRGETSEVTVAFQPAGVTVAADPQRSLLDLAERAGVPLEAGCRMGMCGADPVRVVSGADNLTPRTDEEAATLGRLGYGDAVRLACSARACGPVTLTTSDLRAEQSAATPETAVEPDGRRIVVVGGGIAGVTAAETARTTDPRCRITLIGQEPLPLYNRMGLSRIVHGRSAMSGLHLLPDSWWSDNGIDVWLNTEVQRLDVEGGQLHLATGEPLPFDALVLATGSLPSLPALEGADASGVMTFRTADDALGMRAYLQRAQVTHAVVAGAGLLGLEVAYALRQYGVRVSVLERGERLLGRLLDDTASELLHRYLRALGITVLTSTSAASVTTSSQHHRVTSVSLADGRQLPAQLLVVCAGVRPDTTLAKRAGIVTRSGIVVDDQMRTSHPSVFAAGDVAEHDGLHPGLWSTAVAQARVAGANAAGGSTTFRPPAPVAVLKGVGLDVVSCGVVQPAEHEEVLSRLGPGEHCYRRLVSREGTVVGALSVGRPQDVSSLPSLLGQALADAAEALDLLPDETVVHASA